MKRYRGPVVFIMFSAICIGGIWATLRATAKYPVLGEEVSYSVNQADGFVLTIEEPIWSPFKGYTIRWDVAADSEDMYTFSRDGKNRPEFCFLERNLDGQWYRLERIQDNLGFSSVEFLLGGEEATGLEGSIVQKYDGYGTHLEAGKYRIVLEMQAEDEAYYYLAAEFQVT